MNQVLLYCTDDSKAFHILKVKINWLNVFLWISYLSADMTCLELQHSTRQISNAKISNNLFP